VLKTFPGVFTGIGEFSINKEFVASKITGDVASLTDPALDRILDFAEEVGLVVILHNDIDVPFAKPGTEAAYAAQLEALFRRHPKTTIIWAHIGLGRVVHPASDQKLFVEKIMEDPALKNIYCDVSWDETAKYFVNPDTPQRFEVAKSLVMRFPDRFVFGTDEVAPSSQESYVKVYEQYKPLLEALPPDVREKLLKKNYERIFDEGRRRVREWEAKNVVNSTNSGGN
jgi:predicted TIM-barrel fold metal-dependent hydrolase